MEVNSTCPILLLAHHKLQFYYLIKISAPQFPPKRIRAEKQCWKCFRPEYEGSRAKRYCKNPCDDCNRVDGDGRDSKQTTRPCQNKIDSPDVGGDGRMGQ
jgi:hypothetical protein